MKKVISPLLFCVLSVSLLAQTEQSRPLVLTHVTVIDGTGAPAKPDMTIVVIGDRIMKLGKRGQVRPPKDGQVIDASGKFLIPGLWDMHVHYIHPMFRDTFSALFLANGITGVRDMHSPPVPFEQWRKEIAEGTLLAPRIFASQAIIDGPKPFQYGSIAVSNEIEARQTVVSLKQRGADFIKVYAGLQRETYFAIADETKKQNITFAGHVPDAIRAAEASQAGQKSIEHLTGILVGCSSIEDELVKEDLSVPELARTHMRRALNTYDDKKATALFMVLRKHKTWQCPTLTVLRARAIIDDSDFRNDSRLRYVPPMLKTTIWDTISSRAYGAKNRTPEYSAEIRKMFQKEMELVGAMHRAGVEFLAGTDTANPYVFPGFSLHDELALLVKAGLTPMQALQTATRNPARFLDKLDSLGTVEEGKIADMVILEANPLQDITNTRKINAVVTGGRLISKSELQAMLSKVEATVRGK